MNENPNENPAEHRRLLVIFAIFLAASFLIASLAAWKAIQADKAITALSGRVAALDESLASSPFVSGDAKALDEAISRGIENWLARRREAARNALHDRYRAAPEKVADGKWLYGNPSARFRLIEYADYECPYCKRFHGTPKAIVDGSKGQANWQWRHLPLSFHNPAARREALAAECAGELGGNRVFWVFSELLFQKTAGNGKGVPDLGAVARDAGLDADAFQACMKAGRHLEKVDAQAREAAELGITGTPAIVLLDHKTGRREILRGAQPAQAILAQIRKMLAVEAQQERRDETGAEKAPPENG